MNDIKKKTKNVDTIRFEQSSSLISINKSYTDYLIEVRDKSAKTPVTEDEIIGKVQSMLHSPPSDKKDKTKQ